MVLECFWLPLLYNSCADWIYITVSISLRLVLLLLELFNHMTKCAFNKHSSIVVLGPGIKQFVEGVVPTDPDCLQLLVVPWSPLSARGVVQVLRL